MLHDLWLSVLITSHRSVILCETHDGIHQVQALRISHVALIFQNHIQGLKCCLFVYLFFFFTAPCSLCLYKTKTLTVCIIGSNIWRQIQLVIFFFFNKKVIIKVSNAPLKNKGNHNLGNSVVFFCFFKKCSYLFFLI